MDASGAGGRLHKGGSAAAGGAPARNGLRSAGVEGGALGGVGGLLALLKGKLRPLLRVSERGAGCEVRAAAGGVSWEQDKGGKRTNVEPLPN